MYATSGDWRGVVALFDNLQVPHHAVGLRAWHLKKSNFLISQVILKVGLSTRRKRETHSSGFMSADAKKCFLVYNAGNVAFSSRVRVAVLPTLTLLI